MKFLEIKNADFLSKTKKPESFDSGFKKSGRRGSNSRQPAWKAGALPTELLPHFVSANI